MAVTALILALLVTVLPMPADAGSARMQLDMAPGIVAEAEYWPGEADRPVVLIVHGFLQTREFPTVRRLAEALAAEGFSVLAPSLTLGLDRRRRSLACEALHTHSMPVDIDELRAWTAWLAQRTGKPPVLIGHSAGGVQVAAMLEADRSLAVDRAILISPSYFGAEQGPRQAAELRARAADHLAQGDEEMHSFALSYCGRYVTTAAGLTSYLDWDEERLQAVLGTARSPVAVVFGDRDGHIDRVWLDRLGAHGVELRPVAGADHFFDLTYELELFDEVLQAIAGGRHG